MSKGPNYGGLKIGQNALMGTLFKQLPQAQIGPKFKNLCAHQKASYAKLWAFENKLLLVISFQTPP